MLSNQSTGHYEFITAKRDAALAGRLSPRARAAILGQAYRLPPAKEHRITVDCRTGAKTIETIEDATQKPLKAYRAPVVRRIPPTPEPLTMNPANDIAEQKQRRIAKRMGREPDTTITPPQIVDAICEAFNITLFAVLGKNRTQRIARPRWAAMKIMRDYLCMSTSRIGFRLGNRDHTTSMYGLLRADELYAADPDWRSRYDHALTLLGKQP